MLKTIMSKTIKLSEKQIKALSEVLSDYCIENIMLCSSTMTTEDIKCIKSKYHYKSIFYRPAMIRYWCSQFPNKNQPKKLAKILYMDAEERLSVNPCTIEKILRYTKDDLDD